MYNSNSFYNCAHGNKFLTSKEASKITGCSLRQLQYWRDKEVIVPFINASGTGKTIYYSSAELVELSVLVSLLSLGLNFEAGQIVLNQLRTKEPDFTKPEYKKRFMIVSNNGKLDLMFYEKDKAIVFLEEGKTIVPLWLNGIQAKLKKYLSKVK